MNATLKIPIQSDEQLKHLQKARSELTKAGVTFDSGCALVDGVIDWELDWSLEGAKLTDERDLVFDSEKIKYIMNAEDELRQAGVYFDGMYSEKKDTVVWLFENLHGAELVIRKTRKEPTNGVKVVKPVLKKPRKVPRWIAKRRWVNLNNPLTRKRLGLKKERR